MSYIGHRCVCGHADLRHKDGRDRVNAVTSCDNTRCPCAKLRPTPPELWPTWGLDGQPVERIVAPGGEVSKGMKTCGCDDCKALHAETAAAR